MIFKMHNLIPTSRPIHIPHFVSPYLAPEIKYEITKQKQHRDTKLCYPHQLKE